MIKYILPILAACGLLFAVLFLRAGNQPAATTRPVADPAQAPFASCVAGAGIVEASGENIVIGTEVPGVVAEVFKRVGDRARKDEPLFKLDTRDLEATLLVNQAAVRSARAAVAAEEASLADLRNQYRNVSELGDSRAVSKEQTDSRRFAVLVAEAKLQQANAEVVSAEARASATLIEIDRRTVRARIEGTVMQVKVHPGEYAVAGANADPLMLLGNTDTLDVRVDIDENDAWRLDVRNPRPAVAYVRGNRDLRTPLRFVRVEPYVLPKKSLTGDSTERVDTRVLQVLYGFDPKVLPVYVGQQMDVFIDAAPSSPKADIPDVSR